MADLLIYLLKVSLCIIVFYLSYNLFFGGDTFYRRNRVLLVGIPIISIIIPLIRLAPFKTGVSQNLALERVGVFVSTGDYVETAVSSNITQIDFIYTLLTIYLLVTLVLYIKLAFGLLKTHKIIRKGRVLNERFPAVIITELDYSSFSFFPYIVIPEKIFNSAAYTEVLEHEKIHIKEGHTFDLLLVEILIPLLWFNPFIWLLKRSIVLNHEYIADSKALKERGRVKDYQYTLLNIATGSINIPLAHSFSNLIKKRIVMINKKPSRNYAALKNLVILPVAALLFVMFSFRPATEPKGMERELSEASAKIITQFIARNLLYPLEAKESSTEGKIYVSVEVRKGIVKECEIEKSKEEIDSQLLPEIIVVGYAKNPDTKPVGTKNIKLLEKECIRVAKKLSEVQIPEWQEKEVEFTFAVIFQVR
ncbi:MAG: hypothetical protein CVU13_10835 [Bacteroidetes bacterium HGW-Bacteroidetes-8]|jgi:beta-lactamase regulating signal transducer with metallopeptidase domain|nr:MAG: hypothetical protein CVU13_10835 [Bacteroidetes bacterium HGW-Bacteroidetes-8]